MERSAACVMNIRSEILGLRMSGGNGLFFISCSTSTDAGQGACQYGKLEGSPQCGFLESACPKLTLSVDFQRRNLVFLPRRLVLRSRYISVVHETSTDDRGVRAVSHSHQLCTLHYSIDSDHRVSGRLDPTAGSGGRGGGISYRQAAPVTRLSNNAVVLVDQGRRSSNSFMLTTDDITRCVSSFEQTDQGIANQKSLVLPEKASDTSKQLCVAVDVDEVLGSFLSTLNLFIKETYSVQFDISEYYIYDFMKIWHCSQVEANQRVHAFFDSELFKSGIHPIPGAHQTLLQLATYCQFAVVTSRQHVIKDITLEWIERYYAGIFKGVHFGNHFAMEGPSRPKSEICRSLGANVLIDDNPRYAMECAEAGIEVLLFDLHGSYPWSKTPCGPQHPLITRVRNWQEVERVLLARICASL